MAFFKTIKLNNNTWLLNKSFNTLYYSTRYPNITGGLNNPSMSIGSVNNDSYKFNYSFAFVLFVPTINLVFFNTNVMKFIEFLNDNLFILLSGLLGLSLLLLINMSYKYIISLTIPIDSYPSTETTETNSSSTGTTNITNIYNHNHPSDSNTIKVQHLLKKQLQYLEQ